MTPSFTDRASYLAYRAKWKADYAALSARIRDLKFCRKPKNRGTERWDRAKLAEGNAVYFDCSWAQGVAAILRRKATIMLEDLKLAKIEAKRQYEEAKLAA